MQNKKVKNSKSFLDEDESDFSLEVDAVSLPEKKSKKKKKEDFSLAKKALIFYGNASFLVKQLKGRKLKNIKILGVDPSINGCGICLLDSEGNIIDSQSVTFKQTSNVSTVDKLATIEHKFREILSIYKPEIIVQEDVNASGSYNATKLISYVASTLRLSIYKEYDLESRPPIFLYASTELKKCFTGKGFAEKSEVIESHKNVYNIDFGKDDNQADAFSCAMIGVETIKILLGFSKRIKELEEANIFIPEDLSKITESQIKYIIPYINKTDEDREIDPKNYYSLNNLKDQKLLYETHLGTQKEILEKVKKSNIK